MMEDAAPRLSPLFIFDLDGTLALTEHRQHILDDKDNPNRWRDFFAACVDDLPNLPVIRTMEELWSHADILIWSGRSAEVRAQTLHWLDAHTVIKWTFLDRVLRMRDTEDFTPDEELKASWLDNLCPRDRGRLVAVFDDRDKVVSMWRSKGVACFQVAPGGF